MPPAVKKNSPTISLIVIYPIWSTSRLSTMLEMMLQEKVTLPSTICILVFLPTSTTFLVFFRKETERFMYLKKRITWMTWRVLIRISLAIQS